MKLKEVPKEELELMGYDDIAFLVLKESGKKMKLKDIFAKVCKALDLPESAVDEQIMDFFELMSINKKFTMVEDGYWDLQNRHKLDVVFEDDEEDDENNEEENLEEANEEEVFYEEEDETEDTEDDDLSDLVVVDDLEENNL